MLFALGAASTALQALKSLTSSAKLPGQSTAGGRGSADPFELSSAAPPPAGSTQAIGFSDPPKISPATMNALMAAQNQSPTTASASTSNGPSSASLMRADISSLKPITLGASGTATQSYNATEQMIARQRQAMALTV